MTGTVIVGRNQLPGKATGPTQTRLAEVIVRDQAGNMTDLTDEQVAKVAPVDTLQVTGTPDRTPPVISDLAVSRTRLDGRTGDNRVMFTAHISDDLSDIQYPEIRIVSAKAGLYSGRVELEQVRGDVFRGV